MARFQSPNPNVVISDIDIDPGELGTETITITQKPGESGAYIFNLSLKSGEGAFVKGFDTASPPITGLPIQTYQNTTNTTQTYSFEVNVPGLSEDDLGNKRYLEILVTGNIADGGGSGGNTGGGGGSVPQPEEQPVDNEIGPDNPTLNPGPIGGGGGNLNPGNTDNQDKEDPVSGGGGNIGSGTPNDGNTDVDIENPNNPNGPADPTFDPGG